MGESGARIRHLLAEHINYPPHPPRHASPLFTRNHHRMCIEEDQPCRGCGVRHSTLGDPAQNRLGATQMESHHYYVEDSLALAVDLAKFNARLRPYLQHRYPDEPLYAADMTQAQMEEWIHGHEANLLTLCDKCHRAPLIGIHAVTYPVFAVRDLIQDAWDLTGYVAHSPIEAAQLTALPSTIGTATAPTEGAPANG